MGLLRWVLFIAFAGGIAAAWNLPEARSWLLDQWAALQAKSALDQLGFWSALASLLGVSTLLSSLRYVRDRKAFGSMIAETEASIEEAGARLAALEAECRVLRAGDAESLMLAALTVPGTAEGRGGVLGELAAGLPPLARALGEVLAGSGEEGRREAATLAAFASAAGGEG